MRKAILPPELASAPFGLYANGHNDANRQSTVRGRPMLLGQSTEICSDSAVHPTV